MPGDEETYLEITDVQPCCDGLTLDKKIGRGGQKEVFRGVDENGKRVVVKFTKIDYFWFGNQTVMRDVETEQRALREIDLIKNYNSPHLPSLYDETVEYVNIKSFTYLKYIENYAGDESLYDMIVRCQTIDEAIVMKVVRDIAEALKLYSADGIVHRDIKPQNIVYNQETDNFVLIDGGVHLSPLNGTLSAGVVGTEPFFSPEQASGKRRELDSRSDMFSLGISVYGALTGVHPFAVQALTKEQFEANRANAIYPVLSKEVYGADVIRVIDRLLQKYPHNRYRNPEALLLEFNKEEE